MSLSSEITLKPEDKKEFFKGIGLLLLLHLFVQGSLIILAVVVPQGLLLAFLLFYFIGVTQLIYLIPVQNSLIRRRKFAMAYGMKIGGTLTAVISGLALLSAFKECRGPGYP